MTQTDRLTDIETELYRETKIQTPRQKKNTQIVKDTHLHYLHTLMNTFIDTPNIQTHEQQTQCINMQVVCISSTCGTSDDLRSLIGHMASWHVLGEFCNTSGVLRVGGSRLDIWSNYYFMQNYSYDIKQYISGFLKFN